MVGEPGPVVVAVLTRAPSRGGKSRLFGALGCPPDAALLSALFLDTLDGVNCSGTTRVVFVEPADACDDVRALVSDDVLVRPQSEGSLGDRMRATMAGLFAEGASIVVVVGSDLPDITAGTIEAAMSFLTRDPESLVLGPAHDGGYYLIAATTTPNVFDGIEWGSGHVLEQTRATAAMRGLRVQLLQPLRDVDTPEDLRAVDAARTRAWLLGQSAFHPAGD
jgi:rSAM/selenodomain-associated transferase 1